MYCNITTTATISSAPVYLELVLVIKSLGTIVEYVARGLNIVMWHMSGFTGGIGQLFKSRFVFLSTVVLLIAAERT